MTTHGFRSRALGEENASLPKKRTSQKGFKAVIMNIGRGLQKLLAFFKKQRERRGWRGLLLRIGGIFLALLILTLIGLWMTLPNIDDPETMFPAQSTVITDREGTELYRLFSEQDRTYIKGDAISPLIKKATIAIEDERFLGRSSCFDVRGYIRAALSQIFPGFLVRSGGSTLTQQFAGNALVGRRRSVVRKVRELMLACALEQKYDKGELLELYLNWIPYGSNSYGIEQAARNYFGISAKEVSLAQAAALASLPQRPTYFSPYGKNARTTVSEEVAVAIGIGKIQSLEEIPEAGVRIGLIGQNVGSGSAKLYVGGRADQVLKNMVEQGMISEEDRASAVKEFQTMIFKKTREKIRAPHFVLDIKEQVKTLLGIEESILEHGGFTIETTLDWKIQEAAELAVERHREDTKTLFGAKNIALVALSPETREVLAYVGNADFNDDESQGKIDMVRSPRQPGSSFKAFTYLAAFEAGYGPGSVMYDIPTKFGTDEPQNFDGTFWGITTMRRALGGSRNIPAIKAFFLGGGEEALLSLAAKLGVTSPSDAKAKRRTEDASFDYGWPLGIGAAEVPLIEMVQGYASIADGGRYLPLVTIRRITDKDGNIRYLAKKEPKTQVIDERMAAQITSILSDANVRPNEYWKQILSVPGYEAAAKTGTSNKCLERDKKGSCTLRRPESAWTLGYTPNIIAGVWTGNATSQSLFEKADGLTTAAPIWHDFMVSAQKTMNEAKTTFIVPSGLARPLLSKLSGTLASDCTPVELRVSDLVLEELVPTQEDTSCQTLTVDKVTGLLASAACPIEASEEQSFFTPKSELPERWPLWEKGLVEWTEKQMELWRGSEDHSGSLLPLAVPPTETCDPTLTPGRLEKPSVTLLSPAAGESVPYPSFTPRLKISSIAKVREIRFTVDGKPLRTMTEAPFEASVRVPKSIEKTGTHTLTVTLTDEYFNTASESVSIRFDDDTAGPSISFTQPLEGSVLDAGTPITIGVQAADAGSIDRVQFYLGSVLLTTKRDAPFEFSYTFEGVSGEQTINAVARDSAGNESHASVVVTIAP